MTDPAAGPPDSCFDVADGVYRAVLGRPLDDASRQAVVGELGAGRLSRVALVESLLASLEYREAAAVVAAASAARASGTPFTGFARPTGAGCSERLVEIPWVLTRYRNEQRVLDIGSTNAPPVYHELLALLRVPELVTADLVAAGGGAAGGGAAGGGAAGGGEGAAVQADVRALPLADASVELVLCISTLEHVGRENDRYGAHADVDADGDVAALREITRVLRPQGRLLVTVPFGSREDHGWFVQYDASTWDALVAASGLRPVARDCFEVSRNGWRPVRELARVRHSSYGVGAVAARAVLCAELARP